MIGFVLASLLIQTPPAAPPEWIAASGDDTTAAVVMYAQGQSLSILCRDDKLELLVGGLPSTPEPTRTLQVNLKGPELQDSTWIMGADQATAISTAPGVYARHFRRGGTFVLRIPPENGARGRRYELPLPADSAPVDRVLESCDQPLERAADAEYKLGLPVLRWAEMGRPQYPEGANLQRGGAGAVNLTCVTRADGTLEDCVTNSERPIGQGFGRAALAGARSARLDTIDGKPVTAGQSVTWTIRFQIDTR